MIITPEKNKNLVRTLLEFAYAEYGSALEMLAAAKKTKSPKLKIGYINHALDEYRHASLIFKVLENELKKNGQKFEKEFRFIPQNVVLKGYLDKEGFLIEKLKLKNFVEFVYSNEHLAKQSFENLKKRIKDKMSLNIINEIISEEQAHADYSLEKLNEIMIEEDRHWGHAKKFYESKFPHGNLKIAYKKEKFKNRARMFYLKNFNFLNKIFDPLINFVILIFGNIVSLLKIRQLKDKNLFTINEHSVL